MENPTESVFVTDVVGGDPGWLVVALQTPGSQGDLRACMVPWSEQPVARSQWIDIPLSDRTAKEPAWRVSPTGEFVYLFQGPKLMGVYFDVRKARFGEPFEAKLTPGSKPTFQAGDEWTVRGPGVVFPHGERTSSSLWLMNLPR